MLLSTFPFKYYAMLPESTLTTKIREQSWNLDKLFPLMKTTKKELSRIAKSIEKNPADILKAQHKVALLAAEIRAAMSDLKLINFYDGTILYLHYRLIGHLLEICRKEHKKLLEKAKKILSKDIKLHSQEIENMRKAKDKLEAQAKVYEADVKEIGIGENELLKIYEKLVRNARSLRWKAEKQAQHEFMFSKLALFNSLSRLNKKIKVAAVRIKKTLPERSLLMRRTQKKVRHEDIARLSRLISQSIENASKDAYYSSQLISKLEKEMERLQHIVEKLKKSLKDTNEEDAIKISKPWDEAVDYVKEQLDRDLMQVFRNIFVEYKYIATRKP